MLEDEKPLFPRKSETNSEQNANLRESAKRKLEEAERATDFEFSVVGDLMFCLVCGTKNEPYSTFCKVCGQAFFRETNYRDKGVTNVYGPPPMPINRRLWHGVRSNDVKPAENRKNEPPDNRQNSIFIFACIGVIAITVFLLLAVVILFRMFR